MPRARLRPRHTGIHRFVTVLSFAACVLHAIASYATDQGIAPTLSGEPAWGDGSKCVPLPSDPAATLSFRFENPADQELDGIFVRLPASRRNPGRVYVELRNDVGGHPGEDVLGVQEADLPPGRQWLFVGVGQVFLAAGDRYHLLLRTADGTTGKARVCYLWHREGEAPPEHPWAALQLTGEAWPPMSAASGWLEPVFVLSFTDGSVWGQPYWTIRSGRRDAIFAGRDLEMRLDPSPVQLTGLSARLRQRDPDAVLRYRLMSSNGENIREGVLSPSEGQAPWPTGFAGPIDPPLDPNSDQFYVLVVNAPEARTPAQGFRHYRPVTDFPYTPVSRAPAALAAAGSPHDGVARGESSTPQPSGTMSVFVTTVDQPRCGNDRIDQASERCDGRDGGACPGNCNPDCTCGLDYVRRNVAAEAQVTVSTEDAALGARARGAVDGVVDGLPGNPAHEWATDRQRGEAWIQLTWPAPVKINRVVLHDRPSDMDNVSSGSVILPDREIPFGPIPTDGRSQAISFDTVEVTSLKVAIVSATGAGGLSEIEVVRTNGPVRGGGTTTTTLSGGTGGGTTTTTTLPEGGGGTGGGDSGGGDPDPTGRVFYVGPSGNDGSAGTSRDTAWKTFARAFNAEKPLLAGDTLVLLDGTYTRGTTGLVRVDCTATGNARNGTAGEPITIRAEHERKAALVSDGSQAPFEMAGCAWWRVEGLRAQNADNAAGSQVAGYPFRFHEVQQVTARRLLGSHNNRMQNTHVFGVENSDQVLLEECEAYFFHRHAFSIWRSRGVTLRRNYANSMLYGTRGCCSKIDNRDYGDEAISLYGTSDSIIENCISENQANGYQIHGIKNVLDPSGNGGRNNRVLGSISFEDSVPTLVGSRADGPTGYHNASGNVFRNFVAANMKGNGLFFRGSAGTVVENSTVLSSSANSGFVADGGDKLLGGTCSQSLVCTGTGAACSSNDQCGSGVCTRNPQGCGFTATNVLAINNKGYGMTSSSNQALIDFSNAAGNLSNYGVGETISDVAGAIQHSLSQAPTKIGLGTGSCLLWVPRDSNMHGAGKDAADIGANVLYRYEGGQPTTRPLWDPATGKFPCGAIVPSINDGAKRCTNIHERLNVNRNGCAFPVGYGG